MRKPLMATLAVLVTVIVAGSGIALASTRHHRPRHHPRPHPVPSVTASPSASPSKPADPVPAPTQSSTPPITPPKGGGSCALPKYPDGTCTGVPVGTSLTTVNGDMVITTANTVVDAKDIHGCVTVKAPGVVIKRSKVSCRNSYVIASSDGAYNGTGLVVQDTEIDCGSTSGTAIGDTNFTATRVNIHDCENGSDVDQNVTIEDSYIHNLFNSAQSHTDGIQFAGGHYQIVDGKYVRDSRGNPVELSNAANITIRHNTIYSYNTSDHQDGTSAIISNHGSDVNVLIDSNLMAGGAYTLYCDQGATGVNYRVTNNHFSRAFHPTVGAYGAMTSCSDETSSGNVIHETGQAAARD
jgi:hypothetical protein